MIPMIPMIRVPVAGARAVTGAHLGDVLVAYGLVAAAGTQLDEIITLDWDGTTPGLDLDPPRCAGLDALVDWLTTQYAPAGVTCPWNAGGGFGLGWTPAGVQRDAARTAPEHDVLLADDTPRTARWREAITASRDVIARARAGGWSKADVAAAALSDLPDPAWARACVHVDAGGRLRVGALTGTGGNVGSSDLGVATARHAVSALGLGPRPAPLDVRRAWAWAAVTGDRAGVPLVEATGLHLWPQTPPPDGDGLGLVNPFTWLLAVEGIAALSGPPGGPPFPTQRPATGQGPHQCHAETWLPQWDGPIGAIQLPKLLGDPWLWGGAPDPLHGGWPGGAHPILTGAARWGHWTAGYTHGAVPLGGLRPRAEPPARRARRGAAARR